MGLQRFDPRLPWKVVFDDQENYENAPLSKAGLFEFRLIGLDVKRSSTLNFLGATRPTRGREEATKLTLTLLPDVRLPLLGSPQLRITRAEDDLGREIAFETNAKMGSDAFYGEESWGKERAVLQLALPASDARKLAHLEGVAVYVAVVKREKWEIPDLLAKKTWTRDFTSGQQLFHATIKAAPLAPNSVSFEINVTQSNSTDEADPDEIFAPLLSTDQIFAALRIEDANGALQSRGFRASIGQGNTTANTTFISASASLDGANPGQPLALPLKLIFDAPVELVQTQVPFAFENVPLPSIVAPAFAPSFVALNPAKAPSPFPLVSPAEAATLAGIGPMKFDFENVTLRAALDELAGQSGTPFGYGNGTPPGTLDKTLSLHLETRSFDRAFAEIMDEAGVKAILFRASNTLWSVGYGVPDAGREAPLSGTELFPARVMQLRSTLFQAVDLSDAGSKQGQQNSGLSVNLDLLPDARWFHIGLLQARLTRAEDEAGRSLLLAPDNGQPWSYGKFGLKTPAKGAKMLAHLEGTTFYTVATKFEKWEVPDLLSAPQWTRSFQSGKDKTELTLKPMLKDEKRLILGIEIRSNRPVGEGLNARPLLATLALSRTLQIVDANGALLRNYSYNGGGDNRSKKLSGEFYLANGKPLALPLHFVYSAPVEAVQTEVPFAFENVPLP